MRARNPVRDERRVAEDHVVNTMGAALVGELERARVRANVLEPRPMARIVPVKVVARGLGEAQQVLESAPSGLLAFDREVFIDEVVRGVRDRRMRRSRCA